MKMYIRKFASFSKHGNGANAIDRNVECWSVGVCTRQNVSGVVHGIAQLNSHLHEANVEILIGKCDVMSFHEVLYK